MIIKAEVVSNSSEDPQGRVKLKAEGIWNETELIPKPSGLSLNSGDFVYVMVEVGMTAPFIVCKCRDKKFTSNATGDDEVLFESAKGVS